MLKRNTADEIFWLLREKERENEVSIFVRNHAQGCHVGMLVKLLLPGDKEGQKKKKIGIRQTRIALAIFVWIWLCALTYENMEVTVNRSFKA